jgi:hypothetical protein
VASTGAAVSTNQTMILCRRSRASSGRATPLAVNHQGLVANTIFVQSAARRSLSDAVRTIDATMNRTRPATIRAPAVHGKAFQDSLANQRSDPVALVRLYRAWRAL